MLKWALLSDTSGNYSSSGSPTMQLAKNHSSNDSVVATQQELKEKQVK